MKIINLQIASFTDSEDYLTDGKYARRYSYLAVVFLSTSRSSSSFTTCYRVSDADRLGHF